jgi:uncharacterized protein YbjT (DUF2867 family)
MADRVFVTGASGFVGSAVLDELARRQIPVTALVNRQNVSSAGEVRSYKGDLLDSNSLDEGLRQCRAVIHLVGIIMEKPRRGITFDRLHVQATRSIVDAAKRAGIGRFIHMSALGVRPDAVSQYHKTKWGAEEIVRGSGMRWTIFRPSLIHGPRGQFMQMEARWARKKSPPFFFMPYFGAGILGLSGAGMLQPVYIADVARAFVEALDNPKSIGKTYPLAGQSRLSWPQMHKIASRAIVGKARLTMAIPAWYARFLTGIVPQALLPFNGDQIVMSQEDNTTEMTDFVQDFGWNPVDFESALNGYLGELSGTGD